MKLDYFNIIKEGKKVNINNINFSTLLNESLLDVRQKNASNLSDEEFKYLISFDPVLNNIQNLSNEVMASTPENYIRWLLKMNKLGELKNISPEKMQQYLKAFTQAKNRKNLLPNNDINSYKSIEDLKNALEDAKNNLTANQKNKDAKRNQKELQGEKKPGLYMNGAVELLFNGDEWEVWTPHTYEGSKALRRGASWCTGGDNCYYYDAYTADGQLYVIINKENQKEKLQLFVPNDSDSNRPREFRDAENDSVKFREFVHDNPELLDFFLTQENVTNSYESLEDDSIDDEWDDDKEDDVINEYNLTYNEDGIICMLIDYRDLIKSTIYLDIKDFEEFASTGYNEGGYSDTSKLMEKIAQTEGFINEISWENTDLLTLYKFYLKDSNTSASEMDFTTFLYVLFKTNNADYSSYDVYKWFTSKNEYWQKEVYEKLNPLPAFDLIGNYIYEKLKDLGWNPPKPNYNDYYSTYHNNNYTHYLEQFKGAFLYEFEDCHSVREFYEEYADNGQKSYMDLVNDISFREEEGDINPMYAEFYDYESDHSEEDASQIIDIFMTTLEYNKFVDDEDNEDNDDEIQEVLKLSGVNL